MLSYANQPLAVASYSLYRRERGINLNVWSQKEREEEEEMDLGQLLTNHSSDHLWICSCLSLAVSWHLLRSGVEMTPQRLYWPSPIERDTSRTPSTRPSLRHTHTHTQIQSVIVQFYWLTLNSSCGAETNSVSWSLIIRISHQLICSLCWWHWQEQILIRCRCTWRCRRLSGSSSSPRRWSGCVLYWAPASPPSSDRLLLPPPPSDTAPPGDTHQLLLNMSATVWQQTWRVFPSVPCCLPGWPRTPCRPPPAGRWPSCRPSTPASCSTSETDETEAAGNTLSAKISKHMKKNNDNKHPEGQQEVFQVIRLWAESAVSTSYLQWTQRCSDNFHIITAQHSETWRLSGSSAATVIIPPLCLALCSSYWLEAFFRNSSSVRRKVSSRHFFTSLSKFSVSPERHETISDQWRQR